MENRPLDQWRQALATSALLLLLMLLIGISRNAIAQAGEEVYAMQAQGGIQVGFGQASIMPGEPTRLSYGAQKPTTEAYDSTQVKALLLDVGGKQVAILEYDVIATGRRVARSIKQAVAEATGLDERHLIVAATHNHSYGRAYRKNLRPLLAQRGVEAVQAALGSLRPAQIGVAETQAREDLNLNRAELHGPVNQMLNVLRVDDRQGDLRGLLYHYGTHPTIFTEWGQTQGQFGPGWPGYVSRYVKMRHGFDRLYKRYEHKQEGSALPFVMFAQGAGGDQQPRRSDVTLESGAQKPGKQVFMEHLAQDLLTALRKVSATAQVNLTLRSKTISLPRKDRDARSVLLQALTLNDAALVTIPGELGVELAYRFRDASPFAKNMLITNANDYIGYIVPEKLALEAVTYQAKGVGFEPHYGEQIIDEALRLIDPDHESIPPLDPDTVYGSISGHVDYDGENAVAVGVKRIPAPPNYAGGFWGQRTVVEPDGNWEIDSLAPGTFYLYVSEVDPETPAPRSMKSGYRDLQRLAYGRAVDVRAQKETRNVDFRLSESMTETNVSAITLDEESLSLDGNTLSGRLRIEGTMASDEHVQVGLYPAELRYRKLEAFLKNPVAQTTADSSGQFVIEKAPPGRYRVAALLDVNDNDLPEPRGIDVVAKPAASPVIEVPGEQGAP